MEFQNPSSTVNTNETAGIAFAVHAQDTLNPQVFRDDTPSRPPSRVSTKGSRGIGGHGM